MKKKETKDNLFLFASFLMCAILIVTISFVGNYYIDKDKRPTANEVYENSRISTGMLEVDHKVRFSHPYARIFFAVFPFNIENGCYGSAWFCDPNRPYIMTNSHVVKSPAENPLWIIVVISMLPEKHKKFLSQLGSFEVEVESTYTFIDHKGKRHPCKLLANFEKTQKTDAAMLQVLNIDAWKALPIGDPERVKVGDMVYALGSPKGHINLFNPGYITATHEKFGYIDKDTDWFVHNAHINPGNSGGVLLNQMGEVIGMTTMAPRNTTGMDCSFYINRIKPVYFLVADRSGEKTDKK